MSPTVITAIANVGWADTLALIYPGPALPPVNHIAMQVRLYGGAPDPALLTANPIAFTDVDNGDGTRTLTLFPSFTPDQLQALPTPSAAQMAALAVLANLPAAPGPEVGKALSFAFDIRVSYSDGTAQILAFGLFNVLPGVTTI